MAKGKRYTEDQILAVLREIDNGATIASVARAHCITDQTIYRWREKYAGMSGSELSELRALLGLNISMRWGYGRSEPIMFVFTDLAKHEIGQRTNRWPKEAESHEALVIRTSLQTGALEAPGWLLFG